MNSGEELVDKALGIGIDNINITASIFEAANKKDKPAIELLEYSGREIAKTANGCLNKLNFPVNKPVNMVLAGSVFTKCTNQILNDSFKNELKKISGRDFNFINLHVPPVAGSVLGALENIKIKIDPELRGKVLDALKEWRTNDF